MNPRSAALCALLAASVASPAHARPLITEEVATVGHLMFEAGLGGSYRNDKYKAPDKNEYETVRIPAYAKIGFGNHFETGFTLDYQSQRLHTPAARYEGSRTALFSPEIKISPFTNAGLQFIYHDAIEEV